MATRPIGKDVVGFVGNGCRRDSSQAAGHEPAPPSPLPPDASSKLVSRVHCPVTIKQQENHPASYRDQHHFQNPLAKETPSQSAAVGAAKLVQQGVRHHRFPAFRARHGNSFDRKQLAARRPRPASLSLRFDSQWAAKPAGTDIGIEAQAAVWPRSDTSLEKWSIRSWERWGSLPRCHQFVVCAAEWGESTDGRLPLVPTVRQ